MHNKKKIIILIILSLLILGTITVFAASQEEQHTPSMSIEYYNLSFRDAMCIKYAVDTEFEQNDVKLLVWTSPQKEYKYGSQDAELMSVGTQTINGKEHLIFDYTGISAKQMTEDFYAVAYANTNNNEYYTSVKKYSVLKYTYDILGKTANASANEELRALVSGMIEYGALAQQYFDYKTERIANDDYYQVKLTAGQLFDGTDYGLYLEGEQVTITAPAIDSNGRAFVHWEYQNGTKITDLRECTITVGTENIVCTPIYSEGLYFSSYNNGTCYVSGIGTCKDAEINIPMVSPNGDTVIGIGNEAFFNCTNVKDIIIPDSIVNIGNGAFENCLNLQNIYFLGTIEKWQAITFGDNWNNDTGEYTIICKDGTISKQGKFSVYSQGLAFTSNGDGTCYISGMGDCTDIDIIIPHISPSNDFVTSIGPSAFFNWSKIKSITIPSSVTLISSSAFKGCTGLNNVKIGNNIKSIGEEAFYGCYGLTSVMIPYGVTSIDDYAFYNCNGLTSISLPNSLISIGDRAFFNCNKLADVNIPNSVTSIGMYAFAKCSAMKSITIPNSVTSIGRSAFGNTGLTSVVFDDTVDWYVTNSSLDWSNKENGILVDTTNSSTNVTYFRDTYYQYYWYKK